jgi:multimeric flavodoxin WrbA
MTMKIVAVIGSLRRGNTNEMVRAACRNLLPGEVEIIDLASVKMQFCTGCLYCDEAKTCNIDDDMSKLLDTIGGADGFIFASPVRWSLLSGEMKTFFDRLNPFATTETLSGKKCVLFVVGQSDKDRDEVFSIDAGLQSMSAFCENAGIDVVTTVKAYSCLAAGDIKGTSYLDLCDKAGKELADALRQK